MVMQVKQTGLGGTGVVGSSISLKVWPFKPFINIGGQNSAAGTITYSQTGTTVTVTHTAHAMTADFNGGEIYLPQGTGALLSGWFTGWTYVDANTYTCTSTVSQSTSGNLGTNTAETVTPFSYTVSPTLIKKNVTLQLVYVRKYLSLGTKTIKGYFNNVLNDTTALTTSGASIFGQTNGAGVVFVEDDKYFSNSVSAALQTLTDTSYTFSLQCSLATTWIAAYPSYLTYVSRG